MTSSRKRLGKAKKAAHIRRHLSINRSAYVNATAPCCARVTTGHVAAAPSRKAMRERSRPWFPEELTCSVQFENLRT
jgi:hypothetical protein